MTERAMMTAQDERLQQTGGQSVPRLTSITIIISTLACRFLLISLTVIVIRITTIIIQPTPHH
jgi:hypothetical protein